MSIQKKIVTAMAFATTTLVAMPASSAEPDDITHGKYLILTAGCNDCHTAGYAASGATIPEPEWLKGDSLGFRGPWGTTYAVNLREYMAGLSQEEWVNKARTLKARPPMPWWALNAMTEKDLKAIYTYVRALDTSDNKVPEFVPPDQEPPMPYVQWPMPQ
ncbi:c-type cytochrome [Thiothrix nivea]|uniref:Putative cytochrome c n=1 Tax=Thiothrix nivea (strain ATCC 35100 / DSM 5205 / JP2) TaxID=870187 RepID=A0A656HJD2_THINJ|nr:c-type cytochrome [Thiothrix nivea]EIJ36312.1 putative cytochrome c precursor [Thiothrix nivea DSM 5205]